MLNRYLCSLLAVVLFACGPAEPAQPTEPTRTSPVKPGEEVGNLNITVIVTDEVARTLHGLAQETEDAQELIQTIEALGVTLEAMHPGSTDPSLLPYFTIAVPDTQAAERVIAELQQLAGVEGVYVKPPDEPPQ